MKDNREEKKKKSRWINLVLVLVCFYIFEGCVYKKSAIQDLPVANCDTSGVTYQISVLPILSSNCYGCHSSANYTTHGGSVNLEGYNNLKSQLDAGYVIPNIQHTTAPGKVIDPMPLNEPMLEACDIAKIVAWYQHGYPNN